MHKEQDVLITCKGAQFVIGKRNKRGRYRTLMIQQLGQWQPHKPTRKPRKFLREANSVYDLTSTEQVIKWMHTVYGYPVKSTWLKATKASNVLGLPLLDKRNAKKYYSKTTEISKGHMNQTRKNVRSAKEKPTQLTVDDTTTLRSRKMRKVHTKVYNTQNIIFSDQTGRVP